MIAHRFAFLALVAAVQVAHAAPDHDLEIYFSHRPAEVRERALGNPRERASAQELLDMTAAAKARSPLSPPISADDKRYLTLNADIASLRAALDIVESRAIRSVVRDSPMVQERAKELWLLDEKKFRPGAKVTFKLIHLSAPRDADWKVTTDRVQTVREALSAPGASFDDAASRFSDEGKRENFVYTVEEPQVEGHVWDLLRNRLKPGEQAGPLLVANAVIFVSVVSVDRGEKLPFDQVKEQILDQMQQDAGAKARQEALETLRARIAAKGTTPK